MPLSSYLWMLKSWILPPSWLSLFPVSRGPTYDIGGVSRKMHEEKSSLQKGSHSPSSPSREKKKAKEKIKKHRSRPQNNNNNPGNKRNTTVLKNAKTDSIWQTFTLMKERTSEKRFRLWRFLFAPLWWSPFIVFHTFDSSIRPDPTIQLQARGVCLYLFPLSVHVGQFMMEE